MESALGNQERSDKPIFLLMAMIDYFRIAEWEAGGSLPSKGEVSWAPRSPELSELIDLLTAPEQREGLRHWFDSSEELNPTASHFRDWLEAAINESLEPQQASTSNGG